MINAKTTLLIELSLDEVLAIRKLRSIHYGSLLVRKEEGEIKRFETQQSEMVEPRDWTDIAKGGE